VRFVSRLTIPLLVLALAACQAAAGPSAAPETIVTIGVDLPFRGMAQDVSTDTWNAMRLYLEQVGGRAGRFRVELARYDNAPPPNSVWDDAECRRNANQHLAVAHEVAVIGTYLSTCSKVQVPILNRAPGGPMLLVSHTDTNPGLTKAWEAGEPAVYFPSGRRSYARVLATDDHQGTAAARFAAHELGVKRCFVLDDTETYGVGVADAFVAEAARQGIQVTGRGQWRREAAGYRALFGPARAANVDCVFLGGIYDNHGDQLVKDKVAVLGDNDAVRLLAPDGFNGYPDLLTLPAARGAYVTEVGLSMASVASRPGVPAHFLADFRARFNHDPSSVRVLYGVQALQVVLAAIERSDGTRAGVRDRVFEAPGISIAADRAVLGRPITIASTGDTDANDIRIEQIRAGEQVVVGALAV